MSKWKRWKVKAIPHREKVENLRKSLNCSAIEAVLLLQRNIDSADGAASYFNPTLNVLHNPFVMKDMEKATTRIKQAIDKQENILIYGDYDVDGTTAVSIMYKYLSHSYKNLLFYVPDRFNEGYGISAEGIEYAKKNEVSLIVALDCGIKENEITSYAASLGIDMIICDHHNPGKDIPEAFAVLNPKQKDCNYPYKELSGCGIGFKLIQAYESQYNTGFDIFELLDYVAVSIASDIVPITGENRTLAYLGLEKINNLPSIPFKVMFTNLNINKSVDINDLVFVVGPRLNASGRISHAQTTVDFLISSNYVTANEYFNKINSNNVERQDIDLHTLEEAKKMIDENQTLQKKKTTVLYNPKWHKGVIGIVASRLMDHYYRPTILLTESEGMIAGSARSVAGFDLYHALEHCKEFLSQFGGHQFAAGLTMQKHQLKDFQKRFEDIVSATITEEMLTPLIEYDLELLPEHVVLKLTDIVDKFAPFGPENMKPRFVVKRLKNYEEVRIVGNNHLRLVLNINNQRVACVGFGLGEYLTEFKKGREFDICFSAEKNHWNGKTYLQLNLKDIHFN